MQGQNCQDQQVPNDVTAAPPQQDWLAMMMEQAQSVGLWGGPENDPIEGKAQQGPAPELSHELGMPSGRSPTGLSCC